MGGGHVRRRGKGASRCAEVRGRRTRGCIRPPSESRRCARGGSRVPTVPRAARRRCGPGERSHAARGVDADLGSGPTRRELRTWTREAGGVTGLRPRRLETDGRGACSKARQGRLAMCRGSRKEDERVYPTSFGVAALCTRRESNPQAFRRRNLNPVRLPVPPLVRERPALPIPSRSRQHHRASPPPRHLSAAAICLLPPSASSRDDPPHDKVGARAARRRPEAGEYV